MSDSKTALRTWRREQGLTIEELRDRFAEKGLEAPSVPTLSRIERGQLVPDRLLRDMVSVTGIPARELRPDLAKLFEVGP